jgi:hypothetical protein
MGLIVEDAANRRIGGRTGSRVEIKPTYRLDQLAIRQQPPRVGETPVY